MMIANFFTYMLTISILICVSEIAKFIFISKSENDHVITRIKAFIFTFSLLAIFSEFIITVIILVVIVLLFKNTQFEVKEFMKNRFSLIDIFIFTIGFIYCNFNLNVMIDTSNLIQLYTNLDERGYPIGWFQVIKNFEFTNNLSSSDHVSIVSGAIGSILISEIIYLIRTHFHIDFRNLLIMGILPIVLISKWTIGVWPTQLWAFVFLCFLIAFQKMGLFIFSVFIAFISFTIPGLISIIFANQIVYAIYFYRKKTYKKLFYSIKTILISLILAPTLTIALNIMLRNPSKFYQIPLGDSKFHGDEFISDPITNLILSYFNIGSENFVYEIYGFYPYILNVVFVALVMSLQKIRKIKKVSQEKYDLIRLSFYSCSFIFITGLGESSIQRGRSVVVVALMFLILIGIHVHHQKIFKSFRSIFALRIT